MEVMEVMEALNRIYLLNEKIFYLATLVCAHTTVATPLPKRHTNCMSDIEAIQQSHNTGKNEH
jgi:hypothetical protein